MCLIGFGEVLEGITSGIDNESLKFRFNCQFVWCNIKTTLINLIITILLYFWVLYFSDHPKQTYRSHKCFWWLWIQCINSRHRLQFAKEKGKLWIIKHLVLYYWLIFSIVELANIVKGGIKKSNNCVVSMYSFL